jgi:LysR family nitrogen assimilation transcriptional regulator
MEVRQLRYFIAAFEERSISKAAARFGIAQSAISAQLAHLEAELDTGLFVRASTGVEPTPAGHALFERAQRIVWEIEDAQSVVRNAGTTTSGIVTIDIADTVAPLLGAPLLRAFRKHLPEVTLVVNTEVPFEPFDRHARDRADLRILYFDGRLNGYSGRQIASEELLLVTKRDPDTPPVPARIPLSQALTAPLVLPGSHHGIRRRVEELAQTAGIRIRPPVAEINSLAVTKAAVRDGGCCAILPISSIADEVDGGLMATQQLGDPPASVALSLYMINDAASDVSADARQLISGVMADLVKSGIWRGVDFMNGSDSMHREH